MVKVTNPKALVSKKASRRRDTGVILKTLHFVSLIKSDWVNEKQNLFKISESQLSLSCDCVRIVWGFAEIPVEVSLN
jgi:hypothetical protein